MQSEQQELNDGLDAGAVIRFLSMNPDFFNQHAEVLPRLRIPHPTGKAVSLIEKQVSVLRSKCTNLENSLRDFISVARENEQLHQRLHCLIQEIISAQTITDVVALTRSNLLANFNADDVRVVLLTSEQSDPEAYSSDIHLLNHDDPGVDLFAELFKHRETVCGLPVAAQMDALFGSNESPVEVGSVALIPLAHDRSLGLVVLTSKDETRFASGKGVMFLNQLGEVLSRRVQTLL